MLKVRKTVILTLAIRFTNMLNLPPVRSLIAFEAVVRTGRFARAAEELGITQSAVSQHIKTVEQWIGQRLLMRSTRGTRATSAGKELAEAIAQGTDIINSACSRLREPPVEDNRLVIASLPGFALKWLFPRLLAFDTVQPGINVSINTDLQPVNLLEESVDCAIHYGLADNPGLHVEKLFGERLFPVMSPSLQSSSRSVRHPRDLFRQTILVDDIRPVSGKHPGWHTWLHAAGESVELFTKTRRFGQSNMVIQAAVEGMGIALGRDPLVQDDLASGALIAPFSLTVESDFGYYFVCERENLKLERVALFRDWLLSETSKFRSQHRL